MLINLCFYTLIFNLFSLLIITNNNDCKCKGWKMPLNASQCLFKSFSHSGNTLLSLKNLSFQVSFFSRTFTIISKCKRSPWCKQVNVNCFDCFKNFLSNSLQLSFLSFCFFFCFCFLNYSSLLFAFFLNLSKAFISSYWCSKKYKRF
jgi:hypothetical protein